MSEAIGIKKDERINKYKLDYLIQLLEKNEANYNLSTNKLIFYPFSIKDKIFESDLEELLFKYVSRYNINK